MLTERELRRDEIPLVWTIDRRELIEHVYYLEGGKLVLKPEHYDMTGWPAGEDEKYTPILMACFDRGGWLYGVFDDSALVGVAILDNQFIGPRQDLLQLEFLHVSLGFRGRGLGRRLFELAKAEARKRGAQGLYISATPSRHTVDFYLRGGCRVTRTPEPRLLALEPNDIHMECDL